MWNHRTELWFSLPLLNDASCRRVSGQWVFSTTMYNPAILIVQNSLVKTMNAMCSGVIVHDTFLMVHVGAMVSTLILRSAIVGLNLVLEF